MDVTITRRLTRLMRLPPESYNPWEKRFLEDIYRGNFTVLSDAQIAKIESIERKVLGYIPGKEREPEQRYFTCEFVRGKGWFIFNKMGEAIGPSMAGRDIKTIQRWLERCMTLHPGMINAMYVATSRKAKTKQEKIEEARKRQASLEKAIEKKEVQERGREDGTSLEK